MASTPDIDLVFAEKVDDTGCFGCAERVVNLPDILPDIGDDFDWRVRDYDSFRLFMLEELASRFPERRRWTAADLEVAIIEVLATSLGQLSDMADRVFAEGFLETARRPDSVRRLLSLIGYDPIAMASKQGFIDVDIGTPEQEAIEKLEAFWARNPHAMDTARKAGPQAIHTQYRMVSLDDYAQRLEDHPLVARSKSSTAWTGSWSTIFTAVIPWDTKQSLDTQVPRPEDDGTREEKNRRKQFQESVNKFNKARRIPIPVWDNEPTLRTVLRPYIDKYRMAGQEVILRDAIPVGITIIASINVNRNYFASEVQREALLRLGNGPSGVFAPGRLKFGEDLYASDIIATLMQIDGADNVCLIRFKRAGTAFPDNTVSGRIRLSGLEIAVCDNDRNKLARGYVSIKTNGGRR